jgi:hypothetical protein
MREWADGRRVRRPRCWGILRSRYPWGWFAEMTEFSIVVQFQFSSVEFTVGGPAVGFG